MKAKIKIFFILFIVVMPCCLFAQSATDLAGRWTMYIVDPDGMKMSDQTLALFIDKFIQNEKSEKLKGGEEFTQEDSVKAYQVYSESLNYFMRQEVTFKANNVLTLQEFTNGKLEQKNIKYKYHPDSKDVDIINSSGELLSSAFTLKKEGGTVHLYANTDQCIGLNNAGWKAYLKK